MSSVLATPGQTPSRVKFLRVALATTVLPHTVDTSVTSMMTSAAFDAATTAGSALGLGVMLKDMGKEVVVYDATSLAHLAIYRLVSLVAGTTDSEGDENFATFYVKVWDENGVNAAVALSRAG